MNKRQLLFVYLLLVNIFIWAGDLHFFRENLTFEITDDLYFCVDGEYFFRNSSVKPLKQVLFYPFPQDSLYGKVDSITVFDVNDPKNSKLSKINSKGAFFKVEIPPESEKIYRISYRQKMKSNQAEYILLTAQRWKKAFEEIHYQLIFPLETKIKYISYPPDNIGVLNDKNIYFWEKKDFMPDQNFILKIDE
jgi:hypothetical protein